MEMAAHDNIIDVEQQDQVQHVDEKKKQCAQEPCPSVEKGEVSHDAFGELPPSFSARQVDVRKAFRGPIFGARADILYHDR